MFVVVKEVLHLSNMLAEVGVSQSKPRTLCDNKAAIALAKMHKESEVTTGMQLELLKLRQLFRDGRFLLEYVKSADNYSDSFTSTSLKFYRPLYKHLQGILEREGLRPSIYGPSIFVSKQDGSWLAPAA